MRAHRLTFLALACLWLGRAHAEPTIEVRGRMRIELEQVEHVGRGLLVTGALLDEALGEPMPGWTVALRVGQLDDDRKERFVYGHAEPADLDGGFRFEVPNLERATYVVHLSSPGDTVYAAPAPVEHEIDLGRRALELRLYAPAELATTATTMAVTVEAVALDRGAGASDGEPALESEVPVDLELDGRPTATLLLKNGRGSSQLALEPRREARELTLRARFAGDASRGPAEATARVRLVETSTISLEASPTRVAAGGVVSLSGTLRLGERTLGGLPIVVRRVPVEADGPEGELGGETAGVTTAPDGSFHVQLHAPTRGNRASFQARLEVADAQQRGLQPASSELVLVEVTPGISFEGVRAPTRVALLVGVGLLVGIALLRLGSRVRRDAGAAPTRPAAPLGAAQRLFGTLRIASDRRVGGRVLDADRGRPLPGVRVELHVGDEQLEVWSDAAGRFAFAELPSGAVELRCSLRGHMSLSRTGQIPHRGELATLEVVLTPLRSEVLRLYGAALAPYLPDREQLGPRTPRELARLALASRRGLDAGAVGALRSVVEEACFGERAPGPETVEEVEALVERARQETGGR